MKIEKGKLYYNHQLKCVIKASVYSECKSGIHSNEISVHCKTKEDFEYIESKGYKLTTGFYGKSNYSLYYNSYNCNSQYHIISIDQFKEFHPEKGSKNTDTADNTNPIHYNTKGIQPIDYIEANDMNFNEGNVVKYVTRYKEKNGLEDLNKAKVYLQRLIDGYDKK